MKYSITGIIKDVTEINVISDKFHKREVVITVEDGKYPQHISLQLSQDKCSMLSKSNIGKEVTIHFNIQGREWVSPQGEVKYFNTLDAWKVEFTMLAVEPERNEVEQMDDFDSLPF